MPYINENSRKYFTNLLIEVKKAPIHNAGELNYIISSIINIYIGKKYPDYQALNDVMGVLEGAKLEFYRRTVSAFEDDKIKANGDI